MQGADFALPVARPVLGSEMIEDGEASTVAYVPTARPASTDDVVFVLRECDDDTTAMLAYSSLDLLVERCGEDQPWFGLRTAELGCRVPTVATWCGRFIEHGLDG